MKDRIRTVKKSLEQVLLLLRGGHFVIDIKKAPSLGELAADFKDAVLIDALDGDRFLNASWNGKCVTLRAVSGF